MQNKENRPETRWNQLKVHKTVQHCYKDWRHNTNYVHSNRVICLFSPVSLIIVLSANFLFTVVMDTVALGPTQSRVRWNACEKQQPMRGPHCFHLLKKTCCQVLTQNWCSTSATLIRPQPWRWVADQALIINLIHWCHTEKSLHQRVFEWEQWKWSEKQWENEGKETATGNKGRTCD